MIASRGGADGVHLNGGSEAVAEARSSLKGERIIGAGGLRSRHDAMDIGETGVDYDSIEAAVDEAGYALTSA